MSAAGSRPGSRTTSATSATSARRRTGSRKVSARGRRVDGHAQGHALDAQLLPVQDRLGELLAGLDALAHHHPPALDLALLDLELFLDQGDQLVPLRDLAHQVIAS